MEAGWTSQSDFRSKLIFFGKSEASLYAKQQLSMAFPDDELQKIIREKRYLRCFLQRSLYDDSLTLTLDIVQMRFDKDFIAASRSFISSSKTQLLCPQFMVPSKTIPIKDWLSTKTLQLPRFLLSRIFASSPEKISVAYAKLYGYDLKVKNLSFVDFQRLIMDLIDFYKHNESSNIHRLSHKGFISRSKFWRDLDEEERKNLASIKSKELLEFFSSINMSSILDEIRMYAKGHGFTLHTADDIMFIENVYNHKGSYGMRTVCLAQQILDIKKSISSLTRDYSLPRDSLANYNLNGEGVLFKIMTIVDLSNKLKEPIVLRTKSKQHFSIEVKHDVSKTRQQTTLERLPGYSFYVEAKIVRKQQIKLYLHQVIETQNGKEKSTLPIADISIEIGNMYGTICDVLWSASQEHSPDCTSSLSVYDHYHNFKTRSSAFLKKVVHGEVSKEKGTHDTEKIYTGDTECSCCIQLSHRMILDMGVKHYLNSIAGSVIACVRSPATFGKYEPKTIIITGSLLSEWTKLNNTLYRDFIWKQLEEELCLSIYQHQMKVHLIMSHTDVDLFPDEQLVKWEKYQQVVGERRLLVNIKSKGVQGKLYEDKGDRYELVPGVKIDGENRWRLHLIQNDETLLKQSGIVSRYYINSSKDSLPRRLDFDRSISEVKIHFKIDVYLCSLRDQEELLNPFVSLKNTALVVAAPLEAGAGDLKLQHILPGTVFPIVFNLKPENYHLKTRVFLGSGCNKVNGTLLSERITLKRFHHEEFVEHE